MPALGRVTYIANRAITGAAAGGAAAAIASVWSAGAGLAGAPSNTGMVTHTFREMLV